MCFGLRRIDKRVEERGLTLLQVSLSHGVRTGRENVAEATDQPHSSWGATWQDALNYHRLFKIYEQKGNIYISSKDIYVTSTYRDVLA